MVSPQIPTTVKGAGNSLPAPGEYAHHPFTFTFLHPQGTTEPEGNSRSEPEQLFDSLLNQCSCASDVLEQIVRNIVALL